MKYRSSRRAKALDISTETKESVWKRDGGRCVWCGRYGAYVFPDAHFIPRSQGGLGTEENVLTLCRACHNLFDNGNLRTRLMMLDFFADYLKKHYPGWDEENLYYRKDET